MMVALNKTNVFLKLIIESGNFLSNVFITTLMQLKRLLIVMLFVIQLVCCK